MPMACVAVEQAQQVANVGPLTPNSMPTWAEADEPMMRSSVSGMRGALVLDEQVAIGFLEGDEAAGARADDAGRAVGIVEGNLEARLLDGLLGGGGGEPGIAVGVA